MMCTIIDANIYKMSQRDSTSKSMYQHFPHLNLLFFVPIVHLRVTRYFTSTSPCTGPLGTPIAGPLMTHFWAPYKETWGPKRGHKDPSYSSPVTLTGLTQIPFPLPGHFSESTPFFAKKAFLRNFGHTKIILPKKMTKSSKLLHFASYC